MLKRKLNLAVKTHEIVGFGSSAIESQYKLSKSPQNPIHTSNCNQIVNSLIFSPGFLENLSLYLPSKISQKHLGQRHGKGKGRKKGTETIQAVHVGERGETISCALKEDKTES